jgi:hypothetical protein
LHYYPYTTRENEDDTWDASGTKAWQNEYFNEQQYQSQSN